MSRFIISEQEFKDFGDEIRYRQYEINPIKIDVSEILDEIDWEKEYLNVVRINNIDIVKKIKK